MTKPPLRASFPAACVAGVLWAGAMLGKDGDDPKKPPPQEEEEILFAEIPEITTASRTAKPVIDSPSAITVIDKDEIRYLGAWRVPELFRFSPGMDVGKFNAHTWGVGIRGFNAERNDTVLLLQDGRWVRWPTDGGIEWDHQPHFVDNIERIEIVRGPGGVLWGPNATNGVINIVTKDPETTQGTFARTIAAPHGLRHHHLRFGDRVERFFYRLSLGVEEEAGSRIRHDQATDRYRYALGDFRGKLLVGTEGTLDLMAGHKGGRKELGLNDDGQMRQEEISTRFFQARYTHDLSPTDQLQLQASRSGNVSESSATSVSGFKIAPIKQDFVTDELEVQHGARWHEANHLVWGASFREMKLEMPFLGKPERRNGEQGIFAQNETEISPRWGLVAGARWDDSSITDGKLSPRGTLLFHPLPEHTARASVSRAYNAPSMLQEHLGLDLVSSSVARIVLAGNPRLRQSSLTSYELGYRSLWLDRSLDLDAQVYLNRYERQIVPFTRTDLSASPQVISIDWENGTDTEILGTELSGSYKMRDGTTFFANWTLQKLQEVHDRVPGVVTTFVPNLPTAKINAGVRLPLPDGFHFSMSAAYTDSFRIAETPTSQMAPDHTRADLRLAKALWGGAGELAIGVNDLLRTEHREVSRTSPPVLTERVYYISLEGRF